MKATKKNKIIVHSSKFHCTNRGKVWWGMMLFESVVDYQGSYKLPRQLQTVECKQLSTDRCRQSSADSCKHVCSCQTLGGSRMSTLSWKASYTEVNKIGLHYTSSYFYSIVKIAVKCSNFQCNCDFHHCAAVVSVPGPWVLCPQKWHCTTNSMLQWSAVQLHWIEVHCSAGSVFQYITGHCSVGHCIS